MKEIQMSEKRFNVIIKWPLFVFQRHFYFEKSTIFN